MWVRLGKATPSHLVPSEALNPNMLLVLGHPPKKRTILKTPALCESSRDRIDKTKNP